MIAWVNLGSFVEGRVNPLGVGWGAPTHDFIHFPEKLHEIKKIKFLFSDKTWRPFSFGRGE